jgi:hypothetical protein
VSEYPINLVEFERQFSSALKKLVWIICSDSDSAKSLYVLNVGEGYWPFKNGLYGVSGCGHKTSVIAGTIFQDTHKPLTVWFRAIWWITSRKNEASALSLQQILSLRSYQAPGYCIISDASQ